MWWIGGVYARLPPVSDGIDGKDDWERPVMVSHLLIEMFRKLGIEVKTGIDLRAFLTMGIGGRAALAAFLSTESQWRSSIELLHSESIPYVVLGGGSNVVFQDGMISAAVLLNRYKGIEDLGEGLVSFASGTRNSTIQGWTIQHGLSGLEFLAGIPGTIGGAAVVNAGAFGRTMADCLESAHVIDSSGKVRTVGNGDFGYAYRFSRFKFGDGMILRVICRLAHADREIIAARIRQNVKHRLQTHPRFGSRSAGCFFVNPEIDGKRVSAGKLIEECGLKGESANGIRISDCHANFIINDKNGSFFGLSNMEARIRSMVKERKKIDLQREVIYIDRNGEKV